ncbi:hypothetical protein BWQ96_04872 [Gracilariopsis chorda]|uniref:Uncharacterized protein n=1 Tax=Gracilariopsis chorda TaxID=448386 RepID=A0A2V3ITC4_9FLOR|nr:hypothetical protein BWQ96_04872 [Gracilariopsis chorda]|eukprot:PXF45352.1 hypothetical protein BWQ96_04872 [Gracilariopsis chorda]
MKGRCLYITVCLFVLLEQFPAVQSREPNCLNPVERCDPNTNYIPESQTFKIEYANTTIRTVVFRNTYLELTAMGSGRNNFTRYRLVVCGCPVPPDSANFVVLFINPRSVYINESPVLALLHILEPTSERLKYVNTLKTIYTPQIRERIESGQVEQIQDENFTVNYSRLIQDPSLSSGIIGSFTIEAFTGFEGNDVPYLAISEVNEPSPLGRAEWMKVIGFYLGNASAAEQRFADVVKEYEDAKRKAREAVRRPSVLINPPTTRNSGIVDLSKSLDDNYEWRLPHGNQYTTDFMDDANSDYHLSSRVSAKSFVFNMSQVIEDFKYARFHVQNALFPGNQSRDTLEEFLNSLVDPLQPDPRVKVEMAKLAAVRCNNVWHQGKRLTTDGHSNDFFESAIFQPDEVLKDLVSIFHPTVDFGGRETFYMDHYAAETDEYAKDCPYNDFSGPAPSPKVYVDNRYFVTDLNRFDAERKWESDIQPVLKDLDVDAEYDMLFEPKNSEDERSIFLIRALVDEENASELRNNTEILTALRSSLGSGVVQVNADGSVLTFDEGLAGVSIAMIVIGSVLGVGLILFVCFAWMKRRKRGGAKMLHTAQDQYWGPQPSNQNHEVPEVEVPMDP